MDITVGFNDKYAEVKIVDGNATIETGLLDKEQQLRLACDLMDAAQALVHHVKEQIK